MSEEFILRVDRYVPGARILTLELPLQLPGTEGRNSVIKIQTIFFAMGCVFDMKVREQRSIFLTYLQLNSSLIL